MAGFLTAQAIKAGVVIRPSDPLAPYASNRSQSAIDQLDSTLSELEARIVQMNSSQDSLNKRYLELSELRHVLRETAVFFQVAESRVDEINAGAHQEDSSLLAGMQRESIEPHVAGQTVSVG
jgi:V-type H+-transporting ATPase subunit a